MTVLFFTPEPFTCIATIFIYQFDIFTTEKYRIYRKVYVTKTTKTFNNFIVCKLKFDV